MAEVFVNDVKSCMALSSQKRERLRNMDLFVLDNSMRETTVGSLRAHTLDNKRAIYEEVKKAGFKHFVVESFSSETRIGDLFLEELIAAGEDLTNAFAFSEVWEKVENKVPLPDIPIGLIKCKRFGIKNVMFEMDLNFYKLDYEVFTMERLCEFARDKFAWVRENLGRDAMISINIRDFSSCMKNHPDRVWYVVNYLSRLPIDERISGIAYEDIGRALNEELGAWTSAVRQEMVRSGWEDGHLIVHVHEQWGMVHTAALECLASGATGIWAGVCLEGAGIGHADSTTTILNLIRLGNTAVTKKYNCKYLREAAINVTKITTGKLPNPKQPIYGERALDMLFGFVFEAIFEDNQDKVEYGGFDVAGFLGVTPKIRITTMASPAMVVCELNNVFGDDPQFTLDMGAEMLTQILENAADGRKEEYNSQAGLAMLFDQAGGKLTPIMALAVEKSLTTAPHIDHLIAEIKSEWDVWNVNSKAEDAEDEMTFNSFYEGFMSPYFGCYRCEDTQQGLQALDMDNDGMIDWVEFRLYLKWAGRLINLDSS